MKALEATKKFENKYVNFYLIQFSEMDGAGRVKKLHGRCFALA